MECIVKTGIIGCGGIANGKHMPSIKQVPYVRMVAFCDIIPERAEKAAKEYGVEGAKVYTDYRELLSDPEIEVVHVLTPNREHAQITIDALHAGKHVMCEKPMAKCAEDARLMLEAAKATGKKLTIGYQSRKGAAARYAKQYIESGALGEIYSVNSRSIRRRGTPNWGVFLDEEAQGGGPVIDIATHSLDLTLYLMNNYEPKMVLGRTHKKLEHPEAGNIWGDNGVSESKLEDSAVALILMNNGASILLETAWAINFSAEGGGDTVLCGTKGGLLLRDGKLKINSVQMGRQIDTEVDLSADGVAFYDGATESNIVYEQFDWYDAIVNDRDPIVLPEQAYVVSQILEAIYVSSKTGEPVCFD
ncbi:MAG: Gfo/Idh/MocA family protein [Christensenellales bacterium]|jgi:predicted dehydrogenase